MALPRRSARWLLAGAVLIVASIAGARLIDSPAPRVAVARVRVGALESWISTNGVIEPSDNIAGVDAIAVSNALRR